MFIFVTYLNIVTIEFRRNVKAIYIIFKVLPYNVSLKIAITNVIL